MIYTVGKYSKKQEDILYFGFICAIVFADVLGNGNLNLLYFWGILLIFTNLKTKKSYIKDLIIFYLPFCLMVLGEVLFSGNEFSKIKVFAYMAKILVCISLLSYTKNNIEKFDCGRIISSISRIYAILLGVSFLTIHYPYLWRLNDEYNSFSKTRLKFLYSEPSVLGLLCGLLVIFLMYRVFKNKITKKTIRELLLFALIIILTFSMSGIIYTSVAIVVLYLFETFKKREYVSKRLMFYSIFGIGVVIFVLTTKNPVSNRLTAMFMGQDGSYNFRWSAAVFSFKNIMEMTKCWGMGIGNMNTANGMKILLQSGIDYKFANSFLYFATENGFLGILYIIYLISMCAYGCKKGNNTSLRIALFVFVIMSQIAGGYFTDPLLWIIYGMICSKNKKILAESGM